MKEILWVTPIKCYKQLATVERELGFLRDEPLDWILYQGVNPRHTHADNTRQSQQNIFMFICLYVYITKIKEKETVSFLEVGREEREGRMM